MPGKACHRKSIFHLRPSIGGAIGAPAGAAAGREERMRVRSSSRQGLSIGLTHDGQPVRSLTSAVFAQLRAEILSCRLTPGEKFLIAGLARRFGVSLSAVREALSRLAAEDLVQAEDQRGFRVSPVSIGRLRDITKARIDIEAVVLRRAIELGDAGWLA